MNGADRLLVTDEPVDVQNLRKIACNFREIYRIRSNLILGKLKDVKHVTGWSWKHQDFDRLCPNSSVDTDPPQREGDSASLIDKLNMLPCLRQLASRLPCLVQVASELR